MSITNWNSHLKSLSVFYFDEQNLDDFNGFVVVCHIE